MTELDQRLLNDNKLQVINFNQILSRQVNENLIQIGALNSTKTDVLNKMKDIRGARQNLDSNRLHYPQGLNELRIVLL